MLIVFACMHAEPSAQRVMPDQGLQHVHARVPSILPEWHVPLILNMGVALAGAGRWDDVMSRCFCSLPWLTARCTLGSFMVPTCMLIYICLVLFLFFLLLTSYFVSRRCVMTSACYKRASPCHAC